MTEIYEIQLSANALTGSIPSSIGNLGELTNLFLTSNKLSGELPAELGNLNSLYFLSVQDNKLTGPIPAGLASLPALFYVALVDNQFTSLPDFGSSPNATNLTVDVQYNNIGFGSLESNLNSSGQSEIFSFPYAGIKLFNLTGVVEVEEGATLILTANDPGENSAITWEQLIDGVWTVVNAQNEDNSQKTYTRSNFSPEMAGQYRWSMTNPIAPGLTISSAAIEVRLSSPKIRLASNLAYQYKYDGRNRMTHKKVPGADWVYMVYDDRDRLVMTQDGNQRTNTPAEWTFTKYDDLNRPVLSGIYKDDAKLTQDSMQAVVNAFYNAIGTPGNSSAWYETAGTVVHHYTNNAFPDVDTEADYLTASYYDNYGFASALTDFGYDTTQLSATDGTYAAQDTAPFARVIGQATGGKVKNLETGDWYYTINYYDKRYRVIQSVMQNHKGGIDKATNVYDFVGRVTRTKTAHTLSTGPVTTITRKFEYDHVGRLMKSWHKLNNENYVLLVTNEYDELGQLANKKLHSEDGGTTGAQEVDYTYNIRGWLTGMNDPQTVGGRLFSMELKYN
ncbi:MAG: hypothetical protein HC859_12010, partial [Bacteroidia bacterium]|nr:hypothetical protein [Bacteroidia bacterium]